MPKTFRVEEQHEVLVGRIWYGPDVLLLVEKAQEVEVYYAPDGQRGRCIGRHAYADLQEEKPPPGLRSTVKRKGQQPRPPL
jgi:hypothetical protein